MTDDLPFQVEYAKNERPCKGCNESIGKGTLRIANMVQSSHFQWKIAVWHHIHCFFEKKNSLMNVEEIANFSDLCSEDQEKIQKRLGASNFTGGSADIVNSEFSVEYAKYSLSRCSSCCEKILKGVVYISKLNSDNSEMLKYGISPMCYHIDCFVDPKNYLGYSDSADKLFGFNALKDEDKKELREKIDTQGMLFGFNVLKDEDKKELKEKIGSQGIKRKAVEAAPLNNRKSVCKENAKLKIQTEQLCNMRDKLAKHLVKSDLISLLNHNKQHVSTEEHRLLDHLSDCMVFGALKKCPDCKNSCPRFKDNAYVCPGHLTEWTNCQYETKFPEREKFVVPKQFKDEFVFLKNYKCIVQERFLPETAVVSSTSKKNLPLENFKIVLIGELLNASILEKEVMELGASISKEVDNTIKLCISTKNEIDRQSDKIIEAFLNDIHVVSSEFVESVKNGSPVAFSMKEHLISAWGIDPVLKFGIKQEHQKQKYEEDKIDEAQESALLTKITVHGAVAVDSESGLERTCHVYLEEDNIYNVVLAYVDTSKGINSFYKIQLLESNKGSKYHLFRKWGRVGIGISNKKVQHIAGVETAITEFESLYEEKTLNKWWDRKNFVKKPGGMYPLDIDYGVVDNIQNNLNPGSNSKLPKAVQELMCMIFDVKAMEKAMVEFEIDLKKMPLGKLSKKQIDLAYKVLCEAQQILLTGSNIAKITDVTNRFFTLIPHDFGMKKPPLLDHEEIIKSKLEVVDSLMEIEYAYNLIKGDHKNGKDLVYYHYKKLSTDIEVLEKDSEEYKGIHTYFTNTQEHECFNIGYELNEVYKINRHGENERYQKFKHLHNKKLLWHGSRITNFVGILTQGLRIAPPEAPVHGWMFGKGVYFADMAAKSINYCYPSSVGNSILLLCEVALGNMYEKICSESIEKLPDNKHSTLGMGQVIPDPNMKTVVDGVEIPYGTPVYSGIQSVLNRNEYPFIFTNQLSGSGNKVCVVKLNPFLY